MPLRYDFDIWDVVPRTELSPRGHAAALGDGGLALALPTHKLALFRDPATAAALRDAPPHIRQPFLTAGFGVRSRNGGTPIGFYRPEQEQLRNLIVQRLAEAIPHHRNPDPGVYPGIGAFDPGDFIAQFGDARPSPDVRVPDRQSPRQSIRRLN